MKSIVFLLALFLQLSHVRGQSNASISLQELFSIKDTIANGPGERDKVTLLIDWMGSEIKIRRTLRIRYDLDHTRKFRRDSLYVPTPEDTIRANQLSKSFSQNCHSYALEKYFTAEGIADGFLFTEWTVLTENHYMNAILETAFQKTDSHEIKKKKCKACEFTTGTILVFRNKWNTPIHTVYYDGYFHSKYGGGGRRAEISIDPVLKIYWDTTIVEEYKIDWEKVEKF